MFPEFSKDQPDSFCMILADVFGINQNIIKVYNNKNSKFFYLDFVDIALDASKGIEKIERYNLVFEIAILHLEDCFPLITIPNSYLIICVSQVLLYKILGTAKAIKLLIDHE